MMVKVRQEIEKILRGAGIEGDIEFSVPPNPELGDVAFACFGLAKIKKNNPAEAAKELHSIIRLKTTKLVEKIEFHGPYVNFFLNTGSLAPLVIRSIDKKPDALGSSSVGKKKQILIEYPSNNTHKEFHIGHFRNICIGNTLVELYKKSGYKPIPVNYLNDFGAHVVRCLWGMEKFHAVEVPPDNKQKWLGDIYAEASGYAKTHADEVKVELDVLQKKLESKDASIWPVFQETRQWSIDGIQKLFTELGVHHDTVFYESDIKDRGQKVVDELLKKKIATVGEGGAVIVDLQTENLGVALVRKSTGGGLYMTSDLALAEAKFKKYKKIVESITITGSEQNQYFKQLFTVLEKNGFAKKMTHIGYGLVNTPQGKMASRAGNVLLYETLRDEVLQIFRDETSKRHADWGEEKIETTARILALATLKFTISKHEAEKVIVFDLKEATSFEGFTAPYILYAVARINSIHKKAQISGGKINFGALKTPGEKKLLLLLSQYGEIVTKALVNYNPSVIAKYCFDVAQGFNEFYNTHQVINPDDAIVSAARLKLCASARMIMTDALRILTIETVEEM